MDLQRRRGLNLVTSLLTLTLLLVGATGLVAGSEIEAGPELWIDGPDAVQPGGQRGLPDVAVDNDGRRIHVWWASGGTLDGIEIFLRRFDAQGNPLEDPKMVNTTTDDHQWEPRVAVSADGSFLVIFDSDEFHPVDMINRDVLRSQAYNANGDPVGSEQLLSAAPLPGLYDLDPDVAALRTADGTSGGYAVVWGSLASSGSDTWLGIEACLVSATGVPSPQFQVPSDPSGYQLYPSVTELADGGFLVTWVETGQLWGRRFNAAGGPVGNDFVISTSFVAQKLDNDAAIGWDGRVIVVWAEQEDNGGHREIYARVFDADLNPLGPDFRVNTVLTDGQRDPRVADYGPKGFLVVWGSDVASGDDLGPSVEARVVSGVDDLGNPEFGGPQTQLNLWTDDGQTTPGAHGWYGRAATDWRSAIWDGEPEPDVINDDKIIGRDVEHCMFCDDFEWFHPGSPGSLWRWTSTVGLVP